jgi:membrane-bound lytic murein transglycosylase F
MIKLSSKTKFILALLALVAVITTLNVPFDREPKPQTTRDNLAPIEQTTPEREEVISPYDSIIRRVALRYGYDWRFISAVAYTESKFNQSAASNAGAVGLMQITPIVAERYGAHIDSLGNPALNIELGVKLLAHYGESFTFPADIDPKDRISIVLASYNCGIGHLFDVRRLAQSNGEDHNSWEVLQKYLRMKNDPEVYSDSTLVRCGRFEDHVQTIGFVRKVMSRYDYYCDLTEI